MTRRWRRFRDWPIRWKTLLVLVVSGALPLAAAIVFGLERGQAIMVEDATSVLRIQANELVDDLDDYQEGLLREAVRTARLSSVVALCDAPPAERDRLRAVVERDLGSFVAVTPDAVSAVLAGRDLAVLAASNGPAAGHGVASRPCLDRALSGTPALSDVRVDPAAGAVVDYAAPVARGASVAAAILVTVRAEGLWRLMRRRHGEAGGDSYFLLVDALGIRIGQSAGSSFLYHPLGALEPGAIDAAAAEGRFGERTRALLGSPAPFPEQHARARAPT
ncbi:MAG TPA: hypothetical protein VHF22_09195, partial [Planctomycetota bacterium]|nr:hypothetical protein [Planctomycetota bacterium]